ncbi:sulfatase [Amycolatopsis sp. NPDC059021]|uniref:sulfatase n=1 Tax=Amycolatopsis sp. NPDC059021 TaxID=3346704 RepID=UPI00366EB20C
MPSSRFLRVPGHGRLPRAEELATVSAFVLVLFALLAPNEISHLTPAMFVRVPVEGLVGVAVLLVLPPRPRRVVATVLGVLLGLLALVKILDMGFFAALDRPFDPVFDWSFLRGGLDFLAGGLGKPGAIAVAIGVLVLALALVVLVTMAVRRLSRVVVGRRTASTRVVAVLGIVWIVCDLAGVQAAPGEPVAARSAAALAYDDLRQVRADLRARRPLAEEVRVDAFRDTPGDRLLTALRGKDVVFTFVESYGRVALEDPRLAPGIGALLDDGTARLRAAGFGARSAFLTSSTTGGGSWLAHSTLQSGLWIDNQQRYEQLLGTGRLTLTRAFGRAGWKTVHDVPAHTRDWPEGRFYGFESYYDARDVGYRGPGFSYATMPDQYTLSAFQRAERAPGHAPVMAEIDLVSSHAPWTPLPRLVDWNAVGDGTVFGPMPAQGEAPESVWPDPDRVRTAYGKSLEYTLDTLISYVRTYGDDNLVLVFLGDHQPPVVTGAGAGRDVPVTLLAKDPAVLGRISGWGWQDGLKPGPHAPVWQLDAFRDRFLTAFGR